MGLGIAVRKNVPVDDHVKSQVHSRLDTGINPLNEFRLFCIIAYAVAPVFLGIHGKTDAVNTPVVPEALECLLRHILREPGKSQSADSLQADGLPLCIQKLRSIHVQGRNCPVIFRFHCTLSFVRFTCSNGTAGSRSFRSGRIFFCFNSRRSFSLCRCLLTCRLLIDCHRSCCFRGCGFCIPAGGQSKAYTNSQCQNFLFHNTPPPRQTRVHRRTKLRSWSRRA